MTIGIYCLKFQGTDKVYIGQSVNIERRFRTHTYQFNNGLQPKKLQDAYSLYGIPKMSIILECNSTELDDAEEQAMDIYNSISNGFNTCDSINQPPVLNGELNGSSAYTNEEIEAVFNILVNSPTMVAKEIQEVTGVSISVIRAISGGTGHRWLEDKYPTEYKVLIDNSIIRKKNASNKAKESRLIKRGLGSILSPDGRVYQVTCLREFAREHSLDRKRLAKVLNGTQAAHKGWVPWVQQEQV